MADTNRISTLIENQLPEFISTEYENFSKVVEKYYEQLEVRGQPVDVIQNITKYRDIDFYEKNLLKESTTLSVAIDENASTLVVEDATSFPKDNGYIKIADEILFYQGRTDTEFLNVSRGVSGNTKLGDLYESSTFVTTQSAPHGVGSNVQNISNLFLYAIVKNFESDLLAAFPEKYLKNAVDKRTLIKNISDFYKAKGTDKSIKFIFNTLISTDPLEVPEVVNPSDFVFKASTSDWVTTYSLKVKVLSGNVADIVGEQVIQDLDPFDNSVGYASAFVDNVFSINTIDGESLYEVVLDTATLNNTFSVASKTTLLKQVSGSQGKGSRVNVDSTLGWSKTGRFLIGNEEFTYLDKNVSQFVVESRSASNVHQPGAPVYSFSTVTSGDVKLLVLGVLYNLSPKAALPYSEVGDRLEIKDSGFESRDPILFNKEDNQYIWDFNNPNVSYTNGLISSKLGDLNKNISAIYADENYYYICSSSFPGRDVLQTGNWDLRDQKTLRLIRRAPETITESYSTTQRDVGILVDGTLAFSHRDFDQVIFGQIESFNVDQQGDAYQDPPFVLIDDVPGKAVARLSGQVVDRIESLDSSTYSGNPEITITSGRNGTGEAVVTFGRITSIKLTNAGEYYSTPPRVVITDTRGRGRFANYEAILNDDGTIKEFQMLDEGKFYTKGNVQVSIIPVGFGAVASTNVVTWTKDRYNKLQDELDNNNGYAFVNYNSTRGYGYGVTASPTRLRAEKSDNGSTHSPILGFAYDGNPIYGPYGFSDPLDKDSAVSRIRSGYHLNTSRSGGPSQEIYPLGTFIEDYEWRPSTDTGKLEVDENNGRFCVTPEFPRGRYCYFMSIDGDGNPAFPYILGRSYYSLPVDSNYNADLTQEDIPGFVQRLKVTSDAVNGGDVICQINSTLDGNVSGVNIIDSPDTFRVNNDFIVNDYSTEGRDAAAKVSSVIGKNVTSIESKSLNPPAQSKEVNLIGLTATCYLFEGDVITQVGSDYTGVVIGDVSNSTSFTISNVTGTFKEGALLNSDSDIISILTTIDAVYTSGSTILLSDGDEDTLATGRILEPVVNQNSIKVEVLSGEFAIPEDATKEYFLQSTTLGDSVGNQLVSTRALSKNLDVFSVNTDVAMLTTSEPHNVGVGNEVTVDIIPDEAQTTTDYYVRKRFYQELVLNEPGFGSSLKDTGIGKIDILNGGLGYSFPVGAVYNDVELIFFDQSKVRNGIGRPGDEDNARANITIIADGSYGSVTKIEIINKGENYIKGDLLTVADADLNRNPAELSTQRLVAEVDHVGFAELNTDLYLNSVNKLSENDLIKIDSEILKVVSIDSANRIVQVLRGQEGTQIVNHYNGARVESYNGVYRFNEDSRPLGEGINNPYVISYDENTQRIVLAWDYASTSPIQVTQSSVFQDDSTPRKSINIASIEPGENRLEFSTLQDFSEFGTNVNIRIQKYYRYKFDTSHVSMLGVYLDFSASNNYNIFTEEKEVSGVQPGNAGSYVAITLGFGPNIPGVDRERFPVFFDTYYYFIKAGSDVNTDQAYLRVIDDPLTGKKDVLFTTPTKIVYGFGEIPEYEGRGELSYTTTAGFAEGKINSASLSNLGFGYKRLPIIEGVRVSDNNEPILEVFRDSITQSIIGIQVVEGGKGYVSPKAIVTNGDGTGARFNVVHDNGKILRVEVLDGGKGFTYDPVVSVYESAVTAYFESSTIGQPKDISIIQNGGSFHRDESIRSSYTSHLVCRIKELTDRPMPVGGRVEQRDAQDRLIFSARVSLNGYRKGSNILRLYQTKGVIDPELELTADRGLTRVEVLDSFSTEFEPDIRSYYDNIGRFQSDRGKVGASTQRLPDSYYYQDFSYSIKSKTPIEIWRDLIKQTVHPAGFQLFGEVVIDSEQAVPMPKEQTPLTSVTYIELPAKIAASEYKKTQVISSFVNVSSTNVRRGLGTVAINEYDTEGILSRELVLGEPFDGRYATSADYVGSIRAITLPGDDNYANGSGTFAFTSVGTAFSVPTGEYGHWIKFKHISNSRNQPANGAYGGLGSTNNPPQAWDSNDNYNIFGNDEYETNSAGVFDISKIFVMSIGYMHEFGTYPEDVNNIGNPEFGAFIRSSEPDFSKIAYNWKVGDQVTFLVNAATFVTVEITEVDAPAYSPTKGVIGDGNVLGTRKFNLFDKKTNLPYSPFNDQELFVTLNGVAQEPGRSYRIVGSTIEFTNAPLGPQYPPTGENPDDIYTTEPTKFVCKSFKFKQDNYNTRYLKKIRDISPAFDGLRDEFPIYWEDGSIVKTDSNENLLVFINGILQSAKESVNEPLGNAYYIRRSDIATVTDSIVFSEPPRNFADDIDPVPVQLDQRESFFAYGVGNYDRYKIDDRLIPYRGTGPYLMFGEVDNRVKNVSDPEFVLVFVNGVLQAPDTYILNGPNIQFSGPLTKFVAETGEEVYDNVEMISLYGRNVPKTLTLYDFDRFSFRNEIVIDVELEDFGNAQGQVEYLAWQNSYTAFNPAVDKLLFTYDQNDEPQLIGKLQKIEFLELVDGTTTGFTKPDVAAKKIRITALNADNMIFDVNSFSPSANSDDESNSIRSISISENRDFSDAIGFNISNSVYSINWAYSVNDEGERILIRDVASWLSGTEKGDEAYYEVFDLLADLLPGDQIQVDGEAEYRDVLAIPDTVQGRNFRLDTSAKYDHYGTIEVSNYNGITRGEGLSVTTTITDGVVTTVGFSDLEWNKRDLKLFFDTGILLQPTAYQYYNPPFIKFVPVDGNGGGAKAEVLVVGGQILDIKLIDGGSGYTQPPKAVVSRGYNVLRRPERLISTSYALEIGTKVSVAQSANTITTQITISGDGSVSNVFSIVSFGISGSVTPVQGDEIVEHIWPAAEEVGDEFIPLQGETTSRREEFGPRDLLASNLIKNETLITCTIKGDVESISNISPALVGYGNNSAVDQIIVGIDKVITTPLAYFRGLKSGIGAFLDADLSPTATIMYVNSTQLFASSGNLQVGREVVGYGRKLGDRFLDLKRGLQGTLPQQHFAGDYFRTMPEVRIIEAGPRTIVTTSEVSRSEYVETTLTAQMQITAEATILDGPSQPPIEIQTFKEFSAEFDEGRVVTIVEVSAQIAERVVTLTEKSVASSGESVSAGVNVVQSITDVTMPADEQGVTQINEQFQIQLDPSIIEIGKEILIKPDASTPQVRMSESVISLASTFSVTREDVDQSSVAMPEQEFLDVLTEQFQIQLEPSIVNVGKEVIIKPDASTPQVRMSESVVSVAVVAGETIDAHSVAVPEQEPLDLLTEVVQVVLTHEVVVTAEPMAIPTLSSTIVDMGATSVETASQINLTEISTIAETTRVISSIVENTIYNGNLEIAPVSAPPGTDPGGLNSPIPVASILGTETAIVARMHGTATEVVITANHLPLVDGKPKPADIMLNREMGVIDFFEELVVLEASIVTRN